MFYYILLILYFQDVATVLFSIHIYCLCFLTALSSSSVVFSFLFPYSVIEAIAFCGSICGIFYFPFVLYVFVLPVPFESAVCMLLYYFQWILLFILITYEFSFNHSSIILSSSGFVMFRIYLYKNMLFNFQIW